MTYLASRKLPFDAQDRAFLAPKRIRRYVAKQKCRSLPQKKFAGRGMVVIRVLTFSYLYLIRQRYIVFAL